MMPENELSSRPVPARFIGARSLGVTKTVDYEDGGIALQDPSEGLLYQRWRGRLFEAGEDESYIVLDAPFVPEFVALAVPRITEFSFSFDQAMRLAIAYMQDGVAKVQWYDSSIPGVVTTEIGEGVVTPKITMDDKRLVGSNGYQANDLILAYVRDGNLYTRQQRDRFLIEYLQAEDVTPLVKIGMSRGLRLQFMHEIL